MNMPEAEHTHTPNPSGVVAAFPLFPPGSGDDSVSSFTVSVRPRPDERALLVACRAASIRREAMMLLTASVTELSPSDPRHDATYRVVEELRQDWAGRLDRVCGIPSQSGQGLLAKAALLADLVDRDEADQVQGGPALRIAASLADDLLVLGET